MRNYKTKCLTFSAILSAASVALLYVGALFEVLDLSLAALASFAVVLCVIELGGPYPYLIWLCTSVLSLLLLPNRFIALVYLLFAGIYPILKAKLDGIRPILSWALKLSVFNIGLLLAFLAARFIFKLPDEGILLEVSFFALANIAFVLYDIAMSKIILLYIVKLRKRFKIDRFLRD